MFNLTSAVWWKAAGMRILRTIAVILAPYIPTILYTGDYLVLASVVGFAALGSFVTSLAGIAETSGAPVVWYYAILERTVKTAAQALLTLFGTATMFQEVDWASAPQLVGTAVLGSLLIAVMGFLPETYGAPLTPQPILVNDLTAEDLEADEAAKLTAAAAYDENATENRNAVG